METMPMPLDSMAGDDSELTEFRVESPVEIAEILKRLADASIMLTLSTPSGDSVMATVWSMDPQRDLLSLSVGASEEAVRRVLAGGEVVAVGYNESIKLQFILSGADLTRGDTHLTLNTGFPKLVFRFQRRDSFRVRPLMNASPVALIAHPAKPSLKAELRVLDVSIGGVALLLPDSVPPIEAEARISQALITLDGDTRLRVDLIVRRVSRLGDDGKGGDKGLRLGCEMVRLGGQDERALQRYIDLTQRRRRMLAI
jgi:c-di-GMP-binding flagellar brake protein YcgR